MSNYSLKVLEDLYKKIYRDEWNKLMARPNFWQKMKEKQKDPAEVNPRGQVNEWGEQSP